MVEGRGGGGGGGMMYREIYNVTEGDILIERE